MKKVRLDYFLHESLHASWKTRLAPEFKKEYWKQLAAFMQEEYTHTEVYPPQKDIFSAFALCPFENVSVVVVGQDPYHGAGQAHGLSFSVSKGVTVPPSLKNIYKEIQSDCGCNGEENGDLSGWAMQGVLLLNATLTVRAGSPGSHQKKGWEEFTDAVLQRISAEREHVVFLLWGQYAQKKRTIIDEKKHLVLTAPHPSPFSACTGFFGCRHFSATNAYIAQYGGTSIDWCL